MRACARPLILLVATSIALASSCLKAGDQAAPPLPPIAPILETLDGQRSTPFALEFDEPTVVGSTLSMAAAVFNPNATAAILDLQPAEGDAGAADVFGVIGIGGATIDAHARVRFQVQFTPSAPGDFEATVAIGIKDGPRTQLHLHARAVAAPCDALGDTSSVDFGTLAFGSTAASAAIPVHNALDLAWSIAVGAPAGPDADAFQLANDPGEYLLAPAGDVSVLVRFAPTHLGPHVASLAFTPPGACGTTTVALTGTALASAVECARDFADPTAADCALDFDFVDLGERAVKSLQFRNPTSASVRLALAALDEPAGAGDPFGLVADDAAGAGIELPAGAEPVTVEIAYAPTRSGIHHATATFGVVDAGGASVGGVVVPLAGRSGGAKASLSPDALSFRKTATGMSRTLAVTLTNPSDAATGGETLTLATFDAASGNWRPSAPRIVGSGEFMLEPVPPDVLANGIAPGASVTMTVRFAPGTGGAKTALLHLDTNARGGTAFEVPLMGEALRAPPCALTVSPAAINFGTVAPGVPRTLPLTLTNTATNAADACLVSVTPPESSPVYQLPGGALDDVVVNGGESLVVPVQLLPQQVTGVFSDSLLVRISNPLQPDISVAIGGKIERACLLLTQTDVDFKSVKTGCNSRQESVTLYNACTTSVALSSIGLQSASGSSSSTSPFTLTGLGTFPSTLIAGHTTSFTVKYAPTTAGTANDAVIVASAGYPQGFVIALAGTSDATEALNTDLFALPATTKRDVLVLADSYTSDNFVASFSTRFLPEATANSVNYKLGYVNLCDDFPPNSTPVGKITNSLNTSYCWDSSRTQPAFLALSPPLNGTDNAGWLRDDADLEFVIVIADVDPDTRPLSFYEDYFTVIKSGRSRRDRVGVSGLIPMLPTDPDWSTGCYYYTPGAGLNTRLRTFISDTGGRAEEYCTSTTNFPTAVKRLGARVFGPHTVYFLSSPPDMTRTPDPIEVAIDGAPFAASGPRGEVHWNYDAGRNAVVFAPLAAPGAGSTLSITYRVRCL